MSFSMTARCMQLEAISADCSAVWHSDLPMNVMLTDHGSLLYCRGTLSSYCYVLMCIHLLQRRSPPILPVLQQLQPATFRR